MLTSGLVDDTGRDPHQHLLEYSDQSQQASEKDDNSNEEDDSSRDLVIMSRSIGVEEGWALVGVLVTTNETNLGASRGRGLTRLADDGIKATAVGAGSLALSNRLDDVLVGNEKPVSKRCNKFFDRTLPLLSLLRAGILDKGSSQSI